jgi:hypothetical protein
VRPDGHRPREPERGSEKGTHRGIETGKLRAACKK